MIQFDKYVATGGQSSRPFGQFKVPYPKWKPLKRPEEVGITDLPDIDLNPEYKEKGWAICIEGDHFLPGVTAKMIDWFWCNMEKGYYLWAPGSHKRFQWMQEPWEYGFTNSKHTSLENMDEDQILDLSLPQVMDTGCFCIIAMIWMCFLLTIVVNMLLSREQKTKMSIHGCSWHLCGKM